MIHPGVAIVDVEPDGFSAVCVALARRDLAATQTVSVAHRSGVVRAIVHSVDGLLPGPFDPVEDPRATAVTLRSRFDADTVVVIDEEQLGDLSAQLTELGRTCDSQGELLWRARQLWHEHPAVVTVPAPSPPRWLLVAEILASVPDGEWVVLRAERAERGPFVLAGQVDQGLLVRITSVEPPDGVAIEVTAALGVFEAVLGSSDPYAQLRAALADGSIRTTNLPVLK
ncbi:MAG: hypothetical protein ACR2H3_14655 [Acidimicrobiales bacterium]